MSSVSVDTSSSKTLLMFLPQFESLPFEIQQIVVLYLPYGDVVNFCSTSKSNRALLENDSFWKQKLKGDFGPDVDAQDARDARDVSKDDMWKYNFRNCIWHTKYRVYFVKATDSLALFALEYRFDLFQKYLRLGVDINRPTSSSLFPLADFLEKSDVVDMTILRWFLENGADPNSRDRWCRTPLTMCAHDNVEAMKLLLKSGSNPRVIDNHGSPLIMKTRDVSIMRILLEAGANPDDPDVRGFTALWNAVTNLDEDRVKLLFEYGASVFFRSKLGDMVADLPEKMGRQIEFGSRLEEEKYLRISKMIKDRVSTSMSC